VAKRNFTQVKGGLMSRGLFTKAVARLSLR